jgi:two-component system NarL family response regulator
MLEEGGMVIVGEASDGIEAVALAREASPDVVVMDLNMPRYQGIEAIRRITSTRPGVKVVVLTVSAAEDDLLGALEAGACAYMLKDTSPAQLVAGIKLAAAGQAVLTKELARALMVHVHAATRAASEREELPPTTVDGRELTTRESEVLALLVAGADNATIGRELTISPHTVKQYVSNIFEKLGVHSRVQAAVHAVRSGLV